MGSPHFYLEFLLTWVSVLAWAGYRNPAIFALDYALVPDASFPTQVDQTIKGYEHVLAVAKDPSIVCVSGDSAGATLILSMLLSSGSIRTNRRFVDLARRLPKPALAVLISPWTTMVSARHRNTKSDYLDVSQLRRYGLQFAGPRVPWNSPLVSPGCCTDVDWWRRSSPTGGMFLTYGQEEVFATEIEALIKVLREANVCVGSRGEAGGIHAWPVASLFLCSNREVRVEGLKAMTEYVRRHVPGRKNG